MWYLKSRSFQTNLNFLHWKLKHPPQGHFFLLFSAAAPVTPFLPILAKQLGISPFGVGIVFAGTKFQVFSLGLDPNAPLQYSAALWRNGWQAHCRLAGWLSWTTTDSFPSCTPPFRFLLSEIPLHNIPVNFRSNFLLCIFAGLFYFSIQLVSSINGDFTAVFECSQPRSLLKVLPCVDKTQTNPISIVDLQHSGREREGAGLFNTWVFPAMRCHLYKPWWQSSNRGGPNFW